MSQRDAASVVDCLKRTFMSRAVSPCKAGWSKKNSHSNAIGASGTLPLQGSTASRGADKAGSSSTSRHEPIPVFNLAKLRRTLEDQAVLTTGVHNATSDRKDEPGASVAGTGSRIDRPRGSKSTQRSPRNHGFPADYEADPRRKSNESWAEYRRRLSPRNWKRENGANLNRKWSAPTSHQVVLPVQSLASSRRASTKVLPGELHFSRRSVSDNVPLTMRAMTAPGTSEPAGQEMKILSAIKRDASVETEGDDSGTKRTQTVERGKKLSPPTKFSSPRQTGSKNGLHVKSTKSHTTRDFQNAMENTQPQPQPQPEKNLEMKLKNRSAAEFHSEIASLDGTSEQPASGPYMHHKSSKTKPLKIHLGACQNYEAPSGSSKGAHECPATLIVEDLPPPCHKIRLPKLNLAKCHHSVAPGANSTRDGDLHKHKTRTRPSESEYVDAWESFGGSSDRLHEEHGLVNGTDVQHPSNKSNLHTNDVAFGSAENIHRHQAINAQELEQKIKARPLKLKIGTCDAPIPPELAEKKAETVAGDAKASCKQLVGESPPQILVEENGAQASSFGRALKQKLAEGCLPLSSQAQDTSAISCPLCGHSVEDIVHFLIKCVGYRSARDLLFQRIAEIVPPGLFEEFSMLKSAAKATALVNNVFWGSYSDEVDIFVRGFLEKIWKVRDCISNLIFEGLRANPAGYVQTSRTSRAVVTEIGPKLFLTERSGGSPRKSFTTHPTNTREAKSGACKPAATDIGICGAPEKNGALALKLHGQHLTKFEQQEILQYPDIFYLGLESEKIQASSSPGDNNFGYDDERGDYHVKERDQVAYRYEALGILGKGSFGQVLKCHDHKYNLLRAVKIIRNKRRFHQQALVEVKILEHLRDKALAEPNCTNTVNIYESFQFRSHLCITFPLHDISLYEFIRRRNFQGMNLHLIRSFAGQLLESLQFLRKLHVIHSDLKPENILLQQPHTAKIVVIDFGSSCFAHERIYTYIQSRFYRSPEVILGLPYDTMIDIWSFGCILAELYSGHPLFPGEHEVDQLACIMEVLSLPPLSVIEKATRKNMFFDAENNPRVLQNSRGVKRFPGSKDLGFSIGCKDTLFVSFVEACLRWDKNQRLTPEELMQHPWMVAS